MFSKSLDQLRIHLVGVGGCGMSGLAAVLLRQGATVSGSDMQPSTALARLAAAGAHVTTQQDADSLPADADVVVVSAAIPEAHPERMAAAARGIPVIKYAELLGTLMDRYHGVAISGTHGKSTTTAWLAYTLRRAGLDPSFVVGAHVPQLNGGSGVGDGAHFVAEACEFDRSFLHLRPKLAVILNIEEDHLDCYADLAAIEATFAEFVGNVPTDGVVLANACDEACRRVLQTCAATVETFGDDLDCTFRAASIELDGGTFAFDFFERGARLGRVQLGLAGRHNVDNALAVAACARHCGAPWDVIAKSLADFEGAGRRMELRGMSHGVHVLDDYAHHPTEIRATLSAVRQRFRPRRLWCVFQPHQHSRTRFLLEDFAGSFAEADEVIVPDIYFVRDSERERGLVCAEDLVERIALQGGAARHLAQFDEIVTLLARDVGPGDVVMTMGAGDIWKVADELVQRLGKHLPG